MSAHQIDSGCRVDAPAKLNLFLEVLGKRDDGFHEVETLMVAISIHDTLYFKENREGQLSLNCRHAFGFEAVNCGVADRSMLDVIPTGQANLVWKAVDLFRRRAGLSSGAEIQLVKRIPAAAGMGGASSDAAAALLAANSVWRAGWSNQQLAEIAAEIGSDVPFFLQDAGRNGCAAVCRGRGEEVAMFRHAANLQFVVVKPPIGLSTAEVYSHCKPAKNAIRVEPAVEALRAGRLAELKNVMTNRLEPAASQLTPWVNRLQVAFQRLDVAAFQMSGSGSSYFGICRHHRHARRVARVLRAARLGQVFAVRSVAPLCRFSASPA